MEEEHLALERPPSGDRGDLQVVLRLGLHTGGGASTASLTGTSHLPPLYRETPDCQRTGEENQRTETSREDYYALREREDNVPRPRENPPLGGGVPYMVSVSALAGPS